MNRQLRTNYIWLDQYFDWFEIKKDILKRPYITIGFTAYVLLIPLAVTSTKRMMLLLGRRWKPLHQIVYVVAVCVVYHYLWLVKADALQPLFYMLVLLGLLLPRTQWWSKINNSPQIK